MARVLGIGELLWDYLAAEMGAELSEVKTWLPQGGGAPANVVCGLSRLGTTAGLIAAVGCDGEDLITLCEDQGVDVVGVQRHPTAPTRSVYILRSPFGERTFAGFGSTATVDFADAYLDPAQIPASLFVEADFLVLGTIALAYPQSRAAVLRALDLADQHYLRVVLDVNWRPQFWPNPAAAIPLMAELWSRVDFVKLAKEEALWLFDTADPVGITEYLDGVEGVIVTDGGEGAIAYCLSENSGEVEPFPVEAVDTTGAGDAFVAGFIHQLCRQGVASLSDPAKAREIVTYGAAVGALTTLKMGAIAALPTASEVQTFLNSH